MNKICERCKQEFKCGRHSMSTEKCWCFTLPIVHLPENTYADCLCKPCLTEFQNTNPLNSKDQPQTFLKEGADYYFENGLMVLTEVYLKNRGFCCGNNCRHCPY